MSHETISIGAKDASRTHVLAGTYVEEGAGDNTANVTVDIYGLMTDIPIFYHCPGSETADGNPFVADDRVLITNSDEGAVVANMKVVGFEDGLPRECGFSFRLKREDDSDPDNHTLLTDAYDMRHSFVDSNGNWIWTDWIYNAATEYWDLSFHLPDHRSGSWADPSPDLDPNGYWIWYWPNSTLTYALNTQYPYRYKSVDQQKAEDLITPGAYQGLLPYLKRIYSYDPALQPNEALAPDVCTFMAGKPADYAMERGNYKSDGVKRQVAVISSVPYYIRYMLRKENDKPIYYYYWDGGICRSARSVFDNTTSKGDSITVSGDSLDDKVWYGLSFLENTYWVKTKGTSGSICWYNYNYQIMDISCGYQ